MTGPGIRNVLSIAGSDPSGGAGIQADLKAIAANGCYAMTVITALTAQNTQGVTGVRLVEADFVAAQIDAVFADIRVDAVKIGMLGSADIAAAVADALARHRPPQVVLDPVMIAKGGDRLLAETAVRVLRERLLPLASVLTPNLPEAAVLLGEPEPGTRDAMPAMATALRALGPPGGSGAVLLKGGHLPGPASPDLLSTPQGDLWLEAERIATQNTHGTGCTLSSALAARLAVTGDIRLAAEQAKRYVAAAIAAADQLDVGHGHGPTHHFHALWP
ncbi:MAG: bifunctional hydroxymethylpyrimidine kinase/phosphomethylpyrimidine kinase [Thiohalocapsa sp.]|uniref:bifunctional hydroxymethylpyrimidine kinase/phosphomethylpyrimidine kinase n=1 Tax=Thiohalocapsa sp. TaxID=2497641 RepID=UPI0025E697E7|nr:bifunctional hydroxymethylpyrimidine kinase/phosphomethylpyrimidine kinase [Thiohalocapsa sp.]MCG6942728.1 bifunctional hydroxymethylpyrimidine kinase/phosphomethylpyrimidine kinase [Thiohalocapsa sp.]